MTPTVSLVLSLIAALPQELSAITSAYNTVKSLLAAPDQATIGAILLALNTKTDADVTQLDHDASAAVGLQA